MEFSLAAISFKNLITADFNAISFSILGLLMVFSGLIFISFYITVLPKLLALPNFFKKKKVLQEPLENEKNGEDEDTLLAIAIAFHLSQEFPDENEKITWKSHGDIESPWKMSGRVHGLAVRSQAGCRIGNG